MTKTNLSSQNGITTISASTLILASADKVWRVLSKPGQIMEFHPLIKESYLTSDKQSGVGVTRYCALLPMGVMNERITEWIDNRSFTTEVFDGKYLPPFVFMKGKVEIEAIDNHTQSTFTFSYKLKYGFLGVLMNHLFIRPQFKKAPAKYVGGLKRYVENQG